MRRRGFPSRLAAILIAGSLVAGCATSLGGSRPSQGAGSKSPLPALLPKPASVETARGRFTLAPGAFIAVPRSDAGAANAARRFAELLRATRGIDLPIREAATGPIRFAPSAQAPAGEAYALTVTPGGATIAARDPAGLLYGGVTLWQLLTQDAEPGDTVSIDAVVIRDAPRFSWRGLLLDSARHYQSPEFIKRFVDWMAASKLNTLHWHLTDDQGWRLEIKKYPRLTEVGAWRVPAGPAPARDIDPATGRPRRYGGFYTQDQVRDIVAYAAARGITIVPEIGVPGHATAAIAAYPRLGVGDRPPAAPSGDWGVFPNLFNVEEATFAFLEDVLTEVVALFPGPYVHIGGDEAVKDQWKSSPQVQARMAALGIKDEAALQGYVTRRMEAFLGRHDRRLIGWDEIIEGGLPERATVMSWRGIDGAVTAATRGHDTVLSPAPILYFDHRQASTPAEPPGRGRVVTLREVHDFDPAPAQLTQAQRRHILGLQANLWSEHIRTEDRMEHMAYPRALAVADLGWTGPGRRDWQDFVDRLLPQIDRMAPLGLDAAPSAFAVTASVKPDAAARRVEVTLSNQIGSDEIRYTLDGSTPTRSSKRYDRSLDLPVPTQLRAVAYHDGRALPYELVRSFDAASVRRKDDTALKTCTDNLTLALEDDAPIGGPRAVMLTDIMSPCWIFEDAPMDGVTAIEVTVGQLPFNFQIGRDVEKIRFDRPATPDGEIEVIAGGCEGTRIAVLPLAPAARSDALTTLRAAVAPRSGRENLCFTYTARGVDPMWAIDAVQLVTPDMKPAP